MGGTFKDITHAKEFCKTFWTKLCRYVGGGLSDNLVNHGLTFVYLLWKLILRKE